MMNLAFRNWSIRRKLILIIMSATMVALLLASVAFVVYDVVVNRSALEEELRILAGITGDNCRAAIQFDDPSGARNVLVTLNGRRSIMTAVIFSSDGKPFAHYVRDLSDAPVVAFEMKTHGVHWSDNHIWIIQPIQSRGRTIGSIALQSDLEAISSMLIQDIAVVCLLLVFSAIAAFLLAARLQRVIVQPITGLAETARLVSENRDYTLRAPYVSADEVGQLTAAFNTMLGEIQERDASLESYREHLEELVGDRTRELKTTNDQLSVAKEDAEKANRLKSQFLANVSHELRTPMNSILGFSNLLTRHTDAKVREFAETIGRSGKRLMRLIDDVLDLSRVEAGKTRITKSLFPIQSIKVIGDTIRPLLDGKPVDFSVSIEPGVPEHVFSDETKIIQVLTNLVGNAIKFTPSGSISVVCRPGQTSHEVLFTVRDTGIGIKPEDIEFVFEEFYQVSKAREGGSGLGLAISRQLVRALGGRIWVESEFGSGSTFRFTVDITEKPSELLLVESKDRTGDVLLRRIPRPLERNEPGDREWILVAEDEESNQKLYAEMLSEYDFQILSNGKAVLERMHERQPSIVLMDIMMPELDGEGVLKKMKEDAVYRNIPVVAITAKAMVGDRERLLVAGFDEYLSKPIDEIELKGVLLRFGIKGRRSEQNREPASFGDDELLARLRELEKLKFFQSKEIKSVLEILKAGVAGAMLEDIQSLLETFRRRDEVAFAGLVRDLISKLSRAKV